MSADYEGLAQKSDTGGESGENLGTGAGGAKGNGDDGRDEGDELKRKNQGINAVKREEAMTTVKRKMKMRMMKTTRRTQVRERKSVRTLMTQQCMNLHLGPLQSY